MEYRLGQYSALKTLLMHDRGEVKLNNRLLTVVFNMGGGKSAMIKSMFEYLATKENSDKIYLLIVEDASSNYFSKNENYHICTADNPNPVKGKVNVIEQSWVRNVFLRMKHMGLDIRKNNPYKGAVIAIDEGHTLATSPDMVIANGMKRGLEWLEKEASVAQKKQQTKKG